MNDEQDVLKNLWLSTESLYERFGIPRPTKDAVALKLTEETNEAIAEMYNDNVFALAEELADVIVCVMGMAMRGGLSLLDLKGAMWGVACKPNKKKILITIDVDLLERFDALVKAKASKRSTTISDAMEKYLEEDIMRKIMESYDERFPTNLMQGDDE